MLEAAAREVGLELLLDVRRQSRTPRREMRLERRIVFFSELIKEGALRAVARVDRRSNARTGFPASSQWQHDRVLAKSSCDVA